MQPTQEEAQQIFEAHMDTLWTMMEGQITDVEEFHKWCIKTAAALTSTTLAFMYPIKKELTDEHVTEYHQDWEDHESDTQPAN